MNRQLVGALQKGKDYAKNLADPSPYKTLNLDNRLDLNRLGERIGMLNQESARSSDILPLELNDANVAGVPGYSAAGFLNGVGGIADAVTQANILQRGGLDLFGNSTKALTKGSPLPPNSSIA